MASKVSHTLSLIELCRWKFERDASKLRTFGVGCARDFAENPLLHPVLVSWRTGALVIWSNVSFVLRLELHFAP